MIIHYVLHLYSLPLFADAVIPITCFIIVCLFALQHYGTHRVGFLFAPVVLIWLLCISALGLYNIIHWNSHVYQALSPYYMFKFLKKTRKRGWMSLGGILLCITGQFGIYAHTINISVKELNTDTKLKSVYSSLLCYVNIIQRTRNDNGMLLYAGSEAMFADLGHFSYAAIQVHLKNVFY